MDTAKAANLYATFPGVWPLGACVYVCTYEYVCVPTCTYLCTCLCPDAGCKVLLVVLFSVDDVGCDRDCVVVGVVAGGD